ncbi:MAG: MFS transporter [Bacteroidia bacterium]
MHNTSPWAWVPSLYFAEGLPYMMIMVVSGIMYKDLGVSNTDLALYTSLLYLPWVIKPFWSPLVDLFRTNQFWIVSMQILLGLSLAGVAFAIPTSNPLRYTLIFFWIAAFSSATHDIAADGFYMIALREDQQSFFVGFRSFFYRVAMWFAQGALVIAAGMLGQLYGAAAYGWSIAFGISGLIMLALGIFHLFLLPKKSKDEKTLYQDKIDAIGDTGPSAATKSSPQPQGFIERLFDLIVTFFMKKQAILALLFILFYRFSEAQLGKMAQPFMLDPADAGGLGLDVTTVGFIYGTVGLVGLVLGGLLGGFLISRDGLKKWLWPMVIAINIPNIIYIYLAMAQPDNTYLLMAAVAVEQFGYGFGFTAFMMYLIYISQGSYKTAHYAFATGLMALGMMLPGAISGLVQEQLGYTNFFIWIMIATIPAFIITAFLKIDPAFGKRTA